MLLVLALVLTGCSGAGEKTVDGTVDSTTTEGGKLKESGNQTKKGTGASEADGSGNTDAAVNITGYAFMSNGVPVCVNAEVASIVAALGEPLSYFEAASCAFDGLDKTYTYDGFQIETYPIGDIDYVNCIILLDDMTSTPEGIRIGASSADVTAAYGTADEADDSRLVYMKDDMQLMFLLNDGKVSSIQYMMQ